MSTQVTQKKTNIPLLNSLQINKDLATTDNLFSTPCYSSVRSCQLDIGNSVCSLIIRDGCETIPGERNVQFSIKYLNGNGSVTVSGNYIVTEVNKDPVYGIQTFTFGSSFIIKKCMN